MKQARMDEIVLIWMNNWHIGCILGDWENVHWLKFRQQKMTTCSSSSVLIRVRVSSHDAVSEISHIRNAFADEEGHNRASEKQSTSSAPWTERKRELRNSHQVIFIFLTFSKTLLKYFMCNWKHCRNRNSMQSDPSRTTSLPCAGASPLVALWLPLSLRIS